MLVEMAEIGHFYVENGIYELENDVKLVYEIMDKKLVICYNDI